MQMKTNGLKNGYGKKCSFQEFLHNVLQLSEDYIKCIRSSSKRLKAFFQQYSNPCLGTFSKCRTRMLLQMYQYCPKDSQDNSHPFRTTRTNLRKDAPKSIILCFILLNSLQSLSFSILICINLIFFYIFKTFYYSSKL